MAAGWRVSDPTLSQDRSYTVRWEENQERWGTEGTTKSTAVRDTEAKLASPARARYMPNANHGFTKTDGTLLTGGSVDDKQKSG